MYKSVEEIAELQRLYDSGKLAPTRKEKLIVNPKVAIEITNDDILRSIPFKEIEKNSDEFGKINQFSMITPTDNLLWDFFFFTDVSHFRPAANAFEESRSRMASTKGKPRYTHHTRGSIAWKKFWIEEGRRIINGYEPEIDGKPCGIRIPGELYFYLNYGVIKKITTDDKGNVVKDEAGFPDFLAMDYYFMKELEARENPALYGLPKEYKQSIVLVKSRRLGFSYKASVGAVYQTAFDKNSLVIIASGTGDDAATCFSKSMELVDFLTEFTPFGLEDIGEAKNNGGWVHSPRTVKSNSGNFKFRMRSTRGPDSAGRKSEIKTVSLFNEDDAISGEGLSRLYVEESGKIENLKAAWTFAEPAMKVGNLYRKGIAVMFGTGGEMVGAGGKKGSSEGLSHYFYRPNSAGLASFRNIYDYTDNQNECGLFFGAMWFFDAAPIIVGGKTYHTKDKNGNPFFWVGEIAINMIRESKRKGGLEKKEYDRFLTQYCKTPGEAFLITSGNRFQVEELTRKKIEIETSLNGYNSYRTPGQLVETGNEVRFIVNHELQPITPSTMNSLNREGCLLQYKPPIYIKDEKTGKKHIPDDAYIISVDPIGINTSGGNSLIAIIVFNTGKYPKIGGESIVATYYGRPSVAPVDYMNRLLLKLSRYYNAKISFENDNGGVTIFNHFLKNNALDRLLPMPRIVTSTNIKNSKTMLRQFGHSMASPKHKDMGENYIYNWLEKTGHEDLHFDIETGEVIKAPERSNLDRIYDEMLIHQLIQYDRNGNYDAVSALMGIMLQMQEIYEMDKAFSVGTNDYRRDEMEEVYNKLFKHK